MYSYIKISAFAGADLQSVPQTAKKKSFVIEPFHLVFIHLIRLNEFTKVRQYDEFLTYLMNQMYIICIYNLFLVKINELVFVRHGLQIRASNGFKLGFIPRPDEA
jgi:hypothetical protein